MKRIGLIWLGIVAFGLPFSTVTQEEVTMNSRNVSEFGKYEGYSEPAYKEWVRASRYLAMRDGVRLAMDIIRPAERGKPVEKALPVVWAYYRYHRAREEDGKVFSMVDQTPSLQTLVRHGYVIVVVDARGTGASYGCGDRGPNTLQEAKHTYEVTEWIANQTWCDGNVGMFGHSYSGYIQFSAANMSPPHLKAIFPSMGTFDFYRILYRGGVFGDKFARAASRGLHYWDMETAAPKVDEDTTGGMLAEARAEHKKNVEPYSFLKSYQYRNTHINDLTFWIENNQMTYLKGVNESGIPVYLWAGWFDFNIRDMFQWFVNLENPQKLTVGPWSHSSYDWYDLLSVEQLRWFDYWLKGIENGIMDEPAIHYAIIRTPAECTWHTAGIWPLPECENVNYYFRAGPSGSVQSVNDGVLVTKTPASQNGHDVFVVDFSATSEDKDMTTMDAKGLTYTTAQLENDITVIGHPVVTLQITSTAQDGDFYVYLEDVDEEGVSHCITDGLLRASHRTSAKPPFDNFGLPYHRHYGEDVRPLVKGQPAKLVFDVLPISYVFKVGHRIRATIACADRSYTEENIVVPAPAVTVYRSREYASNISLPIAK